MSLDEPFSWLASARARDFRRRQFLGGALATGSVVGLESSRAAARSVKHSAEQSPDTAKIAAAIFALSVRDRNVWGDGRAEDAAAIQAAYDEVAEARRNIVFPERHLRHGINNVVATRRVVG